MKPFEQKQGAAFKNWNPVFQLKCAPQSHVIECLRESFIHPKFISYLHLFTELFGEDLSPVTRSNTTINMPYT